MPALSMAYVHVTYMKTGTVCPGMYTKVVSDMYVPTPTHGADSEALVWLRSDRVCWICGWESFETILAAARLKRCTRRTAPVPCALTWRMT